MFSGITNDDASLSGSPPRDNREGEEEGGEEEEEKGRSDGEQRHKTEAKPEARGLREVGENKKQMYGNRTHLTAISSSTVGEKTHLFCHDGMISMADPFQIFGSSQADLE